MSDQSTYPKQGPFVGKRVMVCFNYDTSRQFQGLVIREDAEAPGRMIIRLDDGRALLSTECQYSLNAAPQASGVQSAQETDGRAPAVAAALLAEHLELKWPVIARWFAERNWPDTELGRAAACINDDVAEIIATLRRQRRGIVSDEAAAVAIEIEKKLCALLGREWTVTGISIETLVNDLEQRFQSLVDFSKTVGFNGWTAQDFFRYADGLLFHLKRLKGEEASALPAAGSPFNKSAADRMAAIVDEMIYAGQLDSRSKLSDARLDYGPPFTDPEHRKAIIAHRAPVARTPALHGISEVEAIRLAAISTASMQNTRATAKERIGRDNPCWTQAYADVCTAVDREMTLREQLNWLGDRVLACDYGDNDRPGEIGWRIRHDLLRGPNGERQPAFMYGKSFGEAIRAELDKPKT